MKPNSPGLYTCVGKSLIASPALVVPAAKWAGAVLEWSQHLVLGHWLNQWIHAGRAGESVPGYGH